MNLREFVFLFIKSLNPTNYQEFFLKKKRDTLQYFMLLLFFMILLNGLLSLPFFIHYPTNINQTLSKFERFNITGIDIQLREPITLLEKPKIVLDFTENRTELGDENILITKTDIQWRKFKPSIFSLSLFKTEKTQIGEYSDIISNVHHIKDIYWLLIILALPSLFFIVFLLNMIKFSAVILVTSLVMFLATKYLKKSYGYLKVLRVGVFASSFFLFLDLGLAPLFNLGVIPMLIYIAVFIAALTMKNAKINQ